MVPILSTTQSKSVDGSIQSLLSTNPDPYDVFHPTAKLHAKAVLLSIPTAKKALVG